MARNHQIGNIVRACVAEPWAIAPEKLEEITGFLEFRAAGNEFTEAELAARFGEPEAKDEGGKRQIIEGGIEVIDVFGTIMPRSNLMMSYSGGTSSMQLARAIREAGADDDVKSVILRIDSPGGAASYTPEVAAAIREVSSKKRIIASATNQVCSGAYWIGAACDELYASESTTVGSIGVYSIYSNYKAAYEQKGIKFSVLRAGDLKAAGNPYEELTAERQAALQKTVDDIYVNFVDSVAAFRKTDAADVKANFGQGSTFLAPEAKARGMVDGVLTFEQVVARERERLPSASKSFVVVSERPRMNPKLKAAMFARDLIESIDADDATCQAAFRAYKVGIGRESMTEDEAIKHLTGKESAQPTHTASPDNVSTPDRVRSEERLRITEIKTRGELLGATDEQINELIDSGVDVSEAMNQITAKLAQTHKPLRIRPMDSQEDKFTDGAAAALCMRFEQSVFGDNGADEETRTAFNRHGRELAHVKTLDLCRAHMRARGMRVSGMDQDDAEAYLEHTKIFASGGSVNMRGDHPDLISNMVGKSLTRGAILASVTYPEWCERIEDLPDFKPRSFVDVGIFKYLDAIQEDEPFAQMKFESAINNWIKADRYGDKVGLTPEMLIDDDLGGFARQLRTLTQSGGLTVQREVLTLLYANPTMMDGNAFFSSAHGNLVATGSGGPPSTTQMKLHRALHRKASSYGAAGIPMGAPVVAALVPAELEEAALQTLAPVNSAQGIEEAATKTADGSLNTFRGKVRPIIDAHTDAYSTVSWFTMTSKDYGSPLIYAYQRGFGAAGRRNDWYDNDRSTRYVSVEVRFGVALNNWRTIVKNDGN